MWYMFDNFYQWVYSAPDEHATVNHFVYMWQQHCARNAENLARSMDALFSDYNPISNYDMVEQGADGTRKDTVTSSTTPYGQVLSESETDKAGLGYSGSGTGVLSDFVSTRTFYQNDDQGNATHTETTETPSNTKNMDFDGSTKTGYHDAREHYLKRVGNIGVTTSQQMIESELQIRKTDLMAEFVDRFIHKYCFYVG